MDKFVKWMWLRAAASLLLVSLLFLIPLLWASFSHALTVQALVSAQSREASSRGGGAWTEASAVAESPVVVGTVTKVERDGMVMVRLSDGGQQVMFVNPSTRIIANGQAGSLADIAVGDRVQATFVPNAPAVEIRILK